MDIYSKYLLYEASKNCPYYGKNKIYDTVFPIIDKTDIFLLILYLLFYKSYIAFHSLYFRTKLDEPPLFVRS